MLEVICADHHAKGRNLHDKLKHLKDNGTMDGRLYEWSSLVREVGNDGAHDVTGRVSKDDARETLAFVEALVDYLYVFRARYEDFKKRRARSKAGLHPEWADVPACPTTDPDDEPANGSGSI